MDSIRQTLVDEHASLDRALVNLALAAESSDSSELRRAWSELESDLASHLDVEERDLFPLAWPLHPEGITALRRDHERIRKLIAALGIEVDLHTLRKSSVDALVEMLRQHAEHEDKTVYRWAESEAPEDTRRRFVSLFARTLRSGLHTAPAKEFR